MTQNKLGTKKAMLFFETCKEKFEYLINEFNFSVVSTRKDGGMYEIVFQNNTTAVIVNWERQENRIYTEVYRLVNGNLIPDPAIISPNIELNGYYLDDLLSTRCSGFSPTRFPVDDTGIVQIISNYATLLHQHAADVLNGDFKIFNELEKIVKSRIASNG